MAPSSSPAAPFWLQTLRSGATLRAPRSLRVRLIVVVAVSVALVIGIEGVLELRLMERAAEENLLEAARLTAKTVADDLELRAPELIGSALDRRLREFMESVPAIRAITIVRVTDGRPAVEATTLSSERPDVLRAGRAAVEGQEVVLNAESDRAWWMVAVPIERQGRRDAIVVGVSFAGLERLRTEAWIATLWFAPAAIVLLTVLISVLMRRMVHHPINAIVDTLGKARSGNLRARVQVDRPDEIGMIATGLNAMLSDLEQFSMGLQTKVDEATVELRKKNTELVESYQRVFMLREKLARAEQMAVIGQMSAATAHQIGTPLNLVSGHVQLMTQQCTDPKTLERLRTIEAQVAKVTAAVHTMLDTARQPSTSPQIVDLPPLVRRVGATVRPVIEAAGIQLVMDVRGLVPHVRMDPAQFEVALFDLISNSIDAMPRGGAIHVTLEATGHGVRLGVTDNGIGIAPELLPLIFDAWVTTKPRGKGTGLGLSIVRDIVQAHGGTITVQSEPGHGAAFTIALPVASALVAPADEGRGTGLAATAAEEEAHSRL